MSGAFPETQSAASIQITSLSPTLTSIAQSLGRQSRGRGAQAWMMEVSYPPLSRADFSAIWSFIVNQGGGAGVFTFKPDGYKDARGTVTSCTSAVEAVGATAITVTMSGSLLQGDYIKFASHDKVYVVTDDLSGSGELSIFPALIAATTAAAVTFDDVPFAVSLTSDEQQFSRGPADLHEFSMNIIEAV